MKRKQVSRLTLVLGLAALIALLGTAIMPAFNPGALAATPIYVRPGGDDTNCNGTVDVDYPGTGGPGLACAVKTIQQGINLVDAGGTVFVAAGTYSGPINIAGFNGITVSGVNKATVLVKPSSVLDWNACGRTTDRKAALRVVNSTNVVLENLTIDMDLVKANFVFGFLFCDSTGTVNNNVLKNLALPDVSGGYYEIGGDFTAPGFSNASRAAITISNNEFIDTGRIGVVTHNYVDATITGNTFYKTTDDFGYAIELGGPSTGEITNNIIYGFDTPALSDGSESAGIYIENAFTSALTGIAKDVLVQGNEVYNSQYGLWIGNGFSGFAGDVDIVVTLNHNNIHDNTGGAAWIQDEDKVAGSSVTVTGVRNTLSNNGAAGLRIYSEGDGNIAVSLSEAKINGHGTGVLIEDTAGGASASTYAVAITGSDLSGNTNYAVQNTIAALTAIGSGNWWGSSDPATVAAEMSGSVDYTPWLGTGTDTNADPGFQGDFSNLWVDDDSPQTGAVGRIQEGINLVSGSTVNVAAGTYVENVNIPTSVTLKGAQFGVGVSGRTAAGPGESTIQGLVTVGASNVVVDGFTLTNPGQTYALSIGNHMPSYSGIAITHNIVDTVGAVGLAQNVHAIVLTNGPDSVTIAHNRFNNIKASTKSVSAIGVLDSLSANQSTGVVIQDNTFTDIASATKGAYGVILNNGAGTSGAQIMDNTFSGLNGGWTHAIGLEGPTPNAVVTGNIFSGLTAAGADNAAVLFEKNLNGGTVNVECNQFNGSAFYGVAIHPNDLPGGINGYNYVVDAEKNWWGNASGPYDAITNPSGTGSLVGPKVDFDPWLASNIGCTTTTGNWQNTRTGAFDDLQGSLDDALPNDTILAFGSQPLSGGATATQPGVTINLNGKTAGPGSPFLTVNADDITLNGPGILDGAASSSPGILVNAGADNFILNSVQIKNWADGVEIAGSVTSLKLTNNWIHSNTDAGLQVDSGAALGGIVTIEGNLFKVNGVGVRHDGTGTLKAEYNSWGHLTAPVTPADYIGLVDADPWTFAEVYMDMDPATSDDQIIRSVNESQNFDVSLNVEAKNLFGVTFKFTYDTTKLTYNSVTFHAPWASPGPCTQLSAPPGTISYRCFLASLPAWDGGKLATFNFKAQDNGGYTPPPGPWSALFNVSHLESDTSTAAIGGVKIFVNNAGFNAPTTTDRDITDTNDGQIDITGIAQFTGFVDLQGRPNDSGAALSVYSVATKPGTAIAGATSVSSGAYTTAYIPNNLLTVGSTYYLYFDRPLYLPTTANAATLYAHSKLLSTRPTTGLGTFMLLGGDATDDNVVDLNDATCIGNQYGLPAIACLVNPLTSSSDVNGDGTTNILDLVLFGGNYGLSASPWTP